MKLTFQRRLTLSFLIIFVIFTAGVVVFEQGQARRYRTEALEERLTRAWPATPPTAST